jgi:hypothetical protein
LQQAYALILKNINIHQLNFMKLEWISLTFLRIGWLNAVVGEAWLQKPPHKTPTTGSKSGKFLEFSQTIRLKNSEL